MRWTWPNGYEVVDNSLGTEITVEAQVFKFSMPSEIPKGIQQNPNQLIHTFTDFSTLKMQDSTQAYGPISNTKFRTSALFTSIDTSTAQKAYAVTGGTAFIQEVNGFGLVNLVLKPDEQPIINGISVKYFVYRGLKKSSFLSTNGEILPKAEVGGNDLLKRMWQVKDELNQQKNENQVLVRGDIGLATDTTSQPSTETIDNVFAKHTFSPILEGWQLGEFETIPLEQGGVNTLGQFGLTVITDYPGYHNTLAEIRVLDHTLSVPEFTGNSNNSLGEFDKLYDREKALSYIDLAAYYGLFYNFKIQNHTNNNIQSIQGSAIKSLIIDKFATKNNIYIDIRNNLGASLNLYKTYRPTGNSAKITLNGNNLPYQYNTWPIIKLEIVNNSLDEIKCQLPVGDNDDPILYLVSGEYESEDQKFKILTAESDNTSEFKLKVPNKDGNIFPFYFKINYNRRHRFLEKADNPDTSRMNKMSKFDNIFPFNQILIETVTSATVWNSTSQLKYLGNTSIDEGKDFNLQLGVVKDIIGETVYGFVKLPIEKAGNDNYQTASYPLGLDGGIQQVKTFLQYLDTLKFLNSMDVIETNDTEVVNVIQFHTEGANTILQEDIQNLYSISYTYDEATKLTQAASSFVQGYPIYFVFQEAIFEEGVTNKFQLALQGIELSDNVYKTKIVTPSEPIWCYAYDHTSNSFFSSAYASAFKDIIEG